MKIFFYIKYNTITKKTENFFNSHGLFVRLKSAILQKKSKNKKKIVCLYHQWKPKNKKKIPQKYKCVVVISREKFNYMNVPKNLHDILNCCWQKIIIVNV